MDGNHGARSRMQQEDDESCIMYPSSWHGRRVVNMGRHEPLSDETSGVRVMHLGRTGPRCLRTCSELG